MAAFCIFEDELVFFGVAPYVAVRGVQVNVELDMRHVRLVVDQIVLVKLFALSGMIRKKK